MSIKKTWLLRVPQIRAELAGMEVPVIDRAVFERVFGVRRRRAIQLMHFFGGYQCGQAFLIDRVELLRQLEPIEASSEFVLEHRRRQRLNESLEKVRRARAADRVTLPGAAAAPARDLTNLPAGIFLQPGQVRMEFKGAEDLLAKLFELAQAAANDFEAFCEAVSDGGAAGTTSVDSTLASAKRSEAPE